MAEGVVHRLEVVDVEDHQGQRLVAIGGGVDQPAEVRFEVAPVVQARQRVRHRHLQRGLHDLAQAVGVALAAELAAHARHQFVAVDGAHEIVVHAEVEPAHDAGAILAFRQQQDGQVAGALQRPELAAHAQRIAVA